MNAPRPLLRSTAALAVASTLITILAFGLNACHSGPPPGPGGKAPMVHIPIMEASGNFFGKQLTTDIHFGRANLPGGPQGGPDGKGGGSRGEGRGPRGGGGFNMSGNAGPIGMGGGGSHGGGGGPGGPGGGEDFGGGPSPASKVRVENNPAVQLTLKVTNHGVQPFDIAVLEFSSLLGNFVVNPAKVTVAPEQSVTFDPMTSRLGIPQGDLPIKVRLRSGDKTEEQTLILKIVSADGS